MTDKNKERYVVLPHEYSRIWGGELTADDFSTYAPSPHCVENLDDGIQSYIAYKKQQAERR